MNIFYQVFSIIMLLLLVLTIGKSNEKVDTKKTQLLLDMENWRKALCIISGICIFLLVIVIIIKRSFSFQLLFWLIIVIFNIYSTGIRHLLTDEGIYSIDIFGREQNCLIKWENVNTYKVANGRLIINYRSTNEKYSCRNYKIRVKNEYDMIISKYLNENVNLMK